MSNVAYLVYCSTGCSCCRGDNHYRGPFASQEDAQKAVDHYKTIPLVASQYSRTGNYSIETATVEPISNGRLIINGTRIADGFVTDPLCIDTSWFEDDNLSHTV
ncbi:MAG TPA: hypothetical protein VM577_21335 [Anaerovoracaceae bacterium]|nr:hypothetical protein [Anaerovoracaceae bacterium]